MCETETLKLDMSLLVIDGPMVKSLMVIDEIIDGLMVIELLMKTANWHSSRYSAAI
uniref:Uncharacterized protein n=1 Tax=Arundo donax TaxID=35708 RepID=A0A0A9H4P4_ARUDO